MLRGSGVVNASRFIKCSWRTNGERTTTGDSKSQIESREVPRPGPTGRVVLLTSIRACCQCGGDGRAHAAGECLGRTVEEADGRIYTYDELGRVIQVVWPNAGNVRLISFE
jgi:YD repeat-containing protein